MRNCGIKKVLLLLGAMVLVLSGCSSTKLAEAFDEETVKEAAQEAVGYLAAGEYEKNIEMMDSAMQEALSSEDLKANVETMNEQTGAFKEYKSIAVVGQQDAQGTDMAVAVVVASFEKRNVTYTISFNTDMEVIGLWMK